MFKCFGFNNGSGDPFQFYNSEKSFKYIEVLLSQRYNIPESITRDTIIRELVSENKNKITFIDYYGFLFFLFLSVLFYKKKKLSIGNIPLFP